MLSGWSGGRAERGTAPPATVLEFRISSFEGRCFFELELEFGLEVEEEVPPSSDEEPLLGVDWTCTCGGGGGGC